MIFIFDLDDTLFPLINVNDGLSKQVRETLLNVNNSEKLFSIEDINSIELDLRIQPLDIIIKKYKLNNIYYNKLIETFNNMELTDIKYFFSDMSFLNDIKEYDSYLVTTGFEKLQLSKLKMLGLSHYFKNIFIDNPIDIKRTTKLDFFKKIKSLYNCSCNEFIVIGDNLHSEISAANTLGYTSIWINRFNKENLEIIPSIEVTNMTEIPLKLNIDGRY